MSYILSARLCSCASTWLQAHAKLFSSMFAREDAGDLHLERCMRLLPHQADTGGFFVAVLQKVAELPPSAFVTAPKCDFPLLLLACYNGL